MEVSLGCFKMMLYQYVLMNNPEPKTESDLEADHHLCPGKKHTAEELPHLCFGSCKGPWGHIPVSAPVIHHLVPCQLARGCLIPQVGPALHSSSGGSWQEQEFASCHQPTLPTLLTSSWQLHPPARQKHLRDPWMPCSHCAYSLATRWGFFIPYQLRAEDWAKCITFHGLSVVCVPILALKIQTIRKQSANSNPKTL